MFIQCISFIQRIPFRTHLVHSTHLDQQLLEKIESAAKRKRFLAVDDEIEMESADAEKSVDEMIERMRLRKRWKLASTRRM